MRPDDNELLTPTWLRSVGAFEHYGEPFTFKDKNGQVAVFFQQTASGTYRPVFQRDQLPKLVANRRQFRLIAELMELRVNDPEPVAEKTESPADFMA